MKTGREAGGRLEVWAVSAYALGLLSTLLVVFLGMRAGGAVPIFLWGQGRFLLSFVALAVLIAGAIWSFRKKPFFQRRRRVPFLILALIVGAGSYPVPYPSSHEGHESPVRFRLPFEGEWRVFWGGESKETNVLAAYCADRRWGLDLVVAHGPSAGAQVLAPAAGKVVRAVGDLDDAPPGEPDRRAPPSGNHVVLQVGAREFVILCHLQKGSLGVAEGQSVPVGAPLGRVGTSGWSAFTPVPHLAIHLQDTADPGEGEPIPWRFHDYWADGVRVERGLPRGGVGPGGMLLGQRIRPAK